MQILESGIKKALLVKFFELGVLLTLLVAYCT
jgi:hypothetical protein